MRVIFGLIFYFETFMITVTAFLLLLYFRPIRKIIFKIVEKLKIGDSPVIKGLFWIVFALILIVLVDSVNTYLKMSGTIGTQNNVHLLQHLESIKAHQHDDYIIKYKQMRQFYMAERNIMLSTSALFITFVMRQFIQAFKKIYRNQVEEQKVKSQ